MLRSLALPVAVAAVLTLSACASADDASSTAPASPGASTTQPGSSLVPDASTTAPSDSGPSVTEPSATEPGDEQPDGSSLMDTAAQGDPGVPGLPQLSGASIDDVLRLGAVASWIEQPVLIALSLPATSDCWAFVAEPVVESPTLIVVRVEQPEPCEAPNEARTYAIAVPDGIDTSAELQLAVVGLEHEFTLTLPTA